MESDQKLYDIDELDNEFIVSMRQVDIKIYEFQIRLLSVYIRLDNRIILITDSNSEMN